MYPEVNADTQKVCQQKNDFIISGISKLQTWTRGASYWPSWSPTQKIRVYQAWARYSWRSLPRVQSGTIHGATHQYLLILGLHELNALQVWLLYWPLTYISSFDDHFIHPSLKLTVSNNLIAFWHIIHRLLFLLKWETGDFSYLKPKFARIA